MTLKSHQSGSWTGSSIPTDPFSNADEILTHNGNTWISASPYVPSVEELKKHDEYVRETEMLQATHREKMEALKTLFPRGYSPIPGLEHMIDIARENQLNPLYEQVLKEFDEAQANLHRAVNKLASAVKLTDSEEVETRETATKTDWFNTKQSINSLYGNSPYHTYFKSSAGGIGVNMTSAAALPTSSLKVQTSAFPTIPTTSYPMTKQEFEDSLVETDSSPTPGIFGWLKGLLQ